MIIEKISTKIIIKKKKWLYVKKWKLNAKKKEDDQKSIEMFGKELRRSI